jgi:hypothetical protein
MCSSTVTADKPSVWRFPYPPGYNFQEITSFGSPIALAQSLDLLYPNRHSKLLCSMPVGSPDNTGTVILKQEHPLDRYIFRKRCRSPQPLWFLQSTRLTTGGQRQGYMPAGDRTAEGTTEKLLFRHRLVQQGILSASRHEYDVVLSSQQPGLLSESFMQMRRGADLLPDSHRDRSNAAKCLQKPGDRPGRTETHY